MSKHNRRFNEKNYHTLCGIRGTVCATCILLLTSMTVHAEQIDCKVILCLAGSFPGGCEDAQSYMIDRITDRPPKPPYGTCETVNPDGSQGDIYSGATTNMFTHAEPTVCMEERTYYGEDAGTRCVRWSTTYNAVIRIAVDSGTNALPFINDHVWRTWRIETDVNPAADNGR